MKKIFNIAVLALAGAMFASCEQEHIDAQYIPGNVTAPVLNDIEGCALAADGADLTFEYVAADYGIKAAVGYTLYVDMAGNDMASKQKVTANIGGGKIVVSAKNLNVALLNAGADKEAEAAAEFQLVANMLNNKGAANEATAAVSNLVEATFRTYNAEIRPFDKFAHVWVIGDYCGWDHAASQYLYDYAASGSKYTGLVDFGEKAANGFKLTGIAGWDDSCNWGLPDDGSEVEAEAAELTLITSGGSKDIKCYAKRFYFFSFDSSTLKLAKDWSADQIGIIGLNGDWDNDIVMEYNAYWTRFYADIDAPAATEMKLRADAGWDLNWGAGAVKGGDNIPVEAGQWRVYFDPGQGTIEFSSSMYGKDEPVGGSTEPDPDPEPEPEVKAGLWSIIGNDGDWNTDIYMTAADNGLWISDVVAVTSEFKLRYNASWDSKIDRGAAATAVVGEPFAVAQGGGNIAVEEGLYVITYDSVNETLAITDAAPGWGLIGDALTNAWDNDTYKLTEAEAGVFVSSPVTVGAGNFKLRKNNTWGEEYTGTFVEFGTPFAAGAGADNITLGEENVGVQVIVTLDTNAGTVTIDRLFDGRWGVVGAVNGMTWNGDVLMWQSGEVWKSAPFRADGEFKIRKDGAWDVDRGGEFAAFDTAFDAAQGGKNISLGEDAAGKFFTLVYDPAAETITVSEYK